MGDFMPMFSVIIPIYKVEMYVDKAIQSVLEQTYNDFELILVDDGSPDLCPQKCDEYAKKDNRVKVIHKINGGLVSARKSGAEIAVGKYIVCVDGDDWVDDNYLMEMANVVKLYSPDMICIEHYISNEKYNKRIKLPIEQGIYYGDDIEKIIFPILIESEKGIYFDPSIVTKIIRHDLYFRSQMSVNSDITIGEDHACTKPCIFEAKSIYILKKSFYYYRVNLESMTKNKKPFPWNGPKAIGIHFENQIDMNKFDFQAQVYRSIVHNLFNVAYSQFNRDEPYHVIKKDIKKNISDEYYRKAINNCKYRHNIKGKMALVALKYRLIFLMFFYNRIKGCEMLCRKRK